MEITLSSQIAVFFGTLALGAVLSLFYDVFRVFDVLLVYNFKRVFLADVSYLILCAIATFTYMLIKSMGEIRGYILIGELIGWIACRASIGRLSYKFALTITKFVQKMLVKLKQKIRLIHKIIPKGQLDGAGK